MLHVLGPDILKDIKSIAGMCYFTHISRSDGVAVDNLDLCNGGVKQVFHSIVFYAARTGYWFIKNLCHGNQAKSKIPMQVFRSDFIDPVVK